ncbi:DUF262 domain-containing protein [Georgenia daeguensis]|uniref:GmrSD restriction endonucleases N-terminal domain-containing protein n=1 Tax=Georgenia daeguensis TaxID=908355 RepID=A0ABP6UNM9_9MICO
MTIAALDIEGRSALEEAVSTSLAALSGDGAAPTGVEVAQRFEAADVDFGSEEWVDYIDRVQDWLRLNERIEGFLSTKDVLRSLFSSLGHESIVGKVELNGIRLTDEGLEVLSERVARAVDLKEQFFHDLAETNLQTASERWIEAWDEVISEPGMSPIKAKADTWTIQDFVSKARRGRLELNPSYQRGDVWPTKDAQLLIESILRGIPLPSIIVLRPDSVATTPYEVVDGKQRLTSILRFIGAHPSAVSVVKTAAREFPGYELERLFKEDYAAFRREWKKATGTSLSASDERDRQFPFPLARDFGKGSELERLAGKYYHEVQDDFVLVGGSEAQISDLFEGTTDYRVPVIEYLEATPRQIHEVFHLYNKQGKHLNAEEIRNAVHHELDLMRTISVMAGDGPTLEVAAPFLAPVAECVSVVRDSLEEFGISGERYRRSKVAAWTLAMLLSSSTHTDGIVRKLSTSQQINSLLERVHQKNDPMRSESRIRDLVRVFALACDAHRSAPPWSDRFRGGGVNGRWEELQLVGSLLGLAMAAAVLGEQTPVVLRQKADLIHELSLSDAWKRNPKTQTGVQWNFLATVSLGLVEALGVPIKEVDRELRQRFGHSPVAALQQASAVDGGVRQVQRAAIEPGAPVENLVPVSPSERKGDVVARIAANLGRVSPPMSAGSTEPRAIFVMISDYFRLGLEGLGKHEMARGIVERAGLAWHPSFESAGATVTLAGLYAVERAVQSLLRSE